MDAAPRALANLLVCRASYAVASRWRGTVRLAMVWWGEEQRSAAKEELEGRCAFARRLGVRGAGGGANNSEDEFEHSEAYRSWVEEVFEKELGDPDEAWLRE